jgi:hypothetical protein
MIRRARSGYQWRSSKFVPGYEGAKQKRLERLWRRVEFLPKFINRGLIVRLPDYLASPIHLRVRRSLFFKPAPCEYSIGGRLPECGSCKVYTLRAGLPTARGQVMLGPFLAERHTARIAAKRMAFNLCAMDRKPQFALGSFYPSPNETVQTRSP